LGDNAVKLYYQKIVENTVSEIQLMESMKGAPNIISIEDFQVIERNDEIGWHIFIRMELLSSFPDFLADKKPSEEMAVKLGIDICSALDLCTKRNIIHRDIKPENIFVSQFGDFKIGDFGIAKELEKGKGSMSISGTQNYMAPEVQSMHYDSTVDIYSLGIVMYKLMNNNRLPFIDPDAQMINPQEYHEALERRFSGEEFPNPAGASSALSKVIRKACSFHPSDRYQSAAAFRKALVSIQKSWRTGYNPLSQTRSGTTDQNSPAISEKKDFKPPSDKKQSPMERPQIWVGAPPSQRALGPGYVKKAASVAPLQVIAKKGHANTIAIVLLIAALVIGSIAALNQVNTHEEQTKNPVAFSANG